MKIFKAENPSNKSESLMHFAGRWGLFLLVMIFIGYKGGGRPYNWITPVFYFVLFVLPMCYRWLFTPILCKVTIDEFASTCQFEYYNFKDGRQNKIVPLQDVEVRIYRTYFDLILSDNPVYFSIKGERLKFKATSLVKGGFSKLTMDEMKSYLLKQTILTA